MRLLRPLFVTALAAVAAAGIGISGAQAGIVFCNEFPHTVFIAIAYPQDSGDWLSRGWLEVPTGNCAPFDTALLVKSFYYRAESESFRLDGKNVTMSWGDKGDRSFAVWDDSNFQYYEAQHRVLKSTLKGFSKGLDRADEYDITVTFGADAGAIETSTRKPE